MFETRAIVTAALACLLTGCYFQLGGRDVRLSPDELWREAAHACQRRDDRAQRYLLTRIVERHPSSDFAKPARHHLDELPTCNSDRDKPPEPYSQNRPN